MRKLLSLAFAVFVSFPAVCKAQAPPPDAQTLQPLLEEVRRLRHDLQATAATVQRMQILLYRIRSQMEVVVRINELHEQAQATLAQTRRQHEQVSARIKQQEESFNRSNDPNTRGYIKEDVERLKQWLEQLAQAEPDAQARESESANNTRIEQGKLAELEEQLDRLDKKLESDTSAAERKPPKT
jgi:DNA repair exonuclease SbcCD ATPase subunit